MRKTRKRVFAAVLAATLLFTMPGMSSAAAAEGAQMEDISESVAVLAEYDAAEKPETENEVIQEPETVDSDTDKSGTGEDDVGDADAQEPAEEEAAPTLKEDVKECICGTLCTQDSINEDCPICGAEDADLSCCEGEKTENRSEENKGDAEQGDTGAQDTGTNLCAHHKEHTQDCGYSPASEDGEGSPCTYECHICPIEDLIAALPDEVTEDNAEKVRAQLNKILALYRELTAEEQEQIDLTRGYDLEAALDEANAPVTADGHAEQQADDEAKVDIGGNITYYSTLEEAFSAANGKNATITMLTDAECTSSDINNPSPLVVSGGTITLDMNGQTLSGSGYGTEGGIIGVSGGSLTVRGGGTVKIIEVSVGIICTGGTLTVADTTFNLVGSNYNLAISAVQNGSLNTGKGGTVTINGGTITGAVSDGQIYHYAGTTIINNVVTTDDTRGVFHQNDNTSSGKLTINGGTFNNTIAIDENIDGIQSVEALLGDGYAYKHQGGTWATDDDLAGLSISNVTVEKIPLTINPQAETSWYYNSGAHSLQMNAAPATAGETITYEWYAGSTKLDCTADAYPVPETMAVGNYTYTCKATCDGYTLSHEFTFTVKACPHTGLVYESQENNKHGGTCPDCGTEVSEEHTWVDGVCSVCNLKAVAKVETSDGTIVYLGEGDFANAFNDRKYNNVTVTLLSDIQADSIEMGDTQASVHVLNTSTLDLAGHTITSSDTAIYVYPTGNLTIQDSSSGKTGQVVSISSAAILTQTGMVSLTGGTYTGPPTIDGKNSSTNVSSLLANYGTQATPHYAYFNAQGNPIALGENQRELTGTVTVKECTHQKALQDQGNGTHGGDCPYCGAELAAAPHTLGDGNVCTGCNTQMKVKVEIGNATTYYSDLDAAWTTAYSAQSAEVTLLANVTERLLLSVSDGEQIALNGGSHTLSIVGFSVSGGQLDITGGVFEMPNGLEVLGGTVRLSGGKFISTTGYEVIVCYPDSGLTVDEFLAEGCAYYRNGKPIEMTGQTTLTGTVTVQECEHDASVCKYQPLDGGTSHKKTCLACGMTWDAEPHTLGADNKCAQCEAELVAQVNDACYSDIKAAWGAACAADSATLTLLRDVETGDMLYVNSGNITFDGGNYTLKGTNPALAVNVSGGTLTVANGTISGGHTCVNITDGVLVVKGGKIETSDYEGINVAGGTAIISGGEIRGSSVGVTRGRNAELIISGGTFYCLGNGSTVNVIGGKVGEVLLNYGDANAETHYAFYRDGKPYKLPDGGTLPGGTFTVQQCKEPLAYTHTSGTTRHTQFCQYCGAGNGETDCIFTWTDNTGECVCGATLVVDVSDTDLIYDGIAKEPGVTVTLDGTELTAGYTVTCSNNINAGNNTASVTVSDTNWKYTQKFAIQKAPLTITASNQTITYGGSITQGAGNVTTAGLCTGDVLESITLTASTTNAPGGNITPSAAGIKNSGGGDVTGNYEITYKNGRLTINKADAEITVGTNTYNNTFGDAAFTLDVTDNNTEADVQYEVTEGADVVSVSNGTVTIRNAGTATITVSLPETANYNAAASKTITVTVAKKGGYTVTEQNRSYLYSRENTGSIDLAALLPKDCGTVTYGTPAASGDVAYSAVPAVDNGILSYTLNSGEINAEGTITVTVSTRNYTDIKVTVKVKLTDQMPVSLKTGTEVTLENNVLTYGEPLSKLKFNKAEFVDDDGKTVLGTLAWKDVAATPNAGTTGATWVFTPDDETYAPVEGTAAITVNRAVPEVSAAPTVAGRVYDPSAALQDSDLKGGTVNVPGTWGWQKAGIIPAVNNSGYNAVFTPEDTTNYETVPWTITVNVTKATPYIAGLPAAAAITYGEALKDSLLSGGSVQYGSGTGQAGEGAGSTETVAGAFTWKEPSTKPVAADSNVTEYTIIFTPSDTANYNPAEAKVRLTVNKAQNAPNMPGSAMSVSNSIEKVGSVPLPAGWEWQVKDTALEVGVAVSAVAVYTGADKGNYENETVTVAITRSSCDHVAGDVLYTGEGEKAPTCTEDGLGHRECTKCGSVMESGIVVEALKHTGGTATCSQRAVCTRCNQPYGDTDSNIHGGTEVRGFVAATCTAGGYTGDTYCKDCGAKTGAGNATPALGHDYTGSVTKEPTTESEGTRTYTCSRCGHSYTESIPKLPEETHEHSYGESVTKQPTCTDTGVRTYTCTCGDSYTETIAALGHHYLGSETKKPTTTAEGVMTYTCDRCGHSYTRPIAKLPGDGTTKPGSGQPGDTEPGSGNTEETRPESGIPFIKGEDGKTGWDVICAEEEQAKEGSVINVDMNGTTVVPGDIFDCIRGRDITITFDMGGGIIWSVDGKSVTRDASRDKTGDIDFSVKTGVNAIPVDIVNNVTGERYSIQISLAYEGEFGFTAVLSINLGKENAGYTASLYYYNQSTGELEFICADEVAEDGTASLAFTHASDYVIAIDGDEEESGITEPAQPQPSAGTDESAGDVPENPETGQTGRLLWIIVAILLAAAIGTGTVLALRKKGKDE